MKGKVFRSTGAHYKIRVENGEMRDAVLRGKIRTQGSKATNPVCVGDDVILEKGEDFWAIVDILPRKNFIPRKSVNLSSRMQIMCANVDQALFLFSIDHPVTTLGYADRILATCEAYDISPVIIFNKTDLLQSLELKKKLGDFQKMYTAAGYDCHSIIATEEKYKQEIISILKNKVSFVIGRSGAGKSSLINLIDPDLHLKTGIVSEFSGRGKHTTTFAELHELSFGGEIIDLPGFKEMEVWGINRHSLDQCFPEMISLAEKCKFSNCLHDKEPACKVREAVEEGTLYSSRYFSYLGMLEELSRNEKEDWLGPENK